MSQVFNCNEQFGKIMQEFNQLNLSIKKVRQKHRTFLSGDKATFCRLLQKVKREPFYSKQTRVSLAISQRFLRLGAPFSTLFKIQDMECGTLQRGRLARGYPQPKPNRDNNVIPNQSCNRITHGKYWQNPYRLLVVGIYRNPIELYEWGAIGNRRLAARGIVGNNIKRAVVTNLVTTPNVALLPNSLYFQSQHSRELPYNRKAGSLGKSGNSGKVAENVNEFNQLNLLTTETSGRAVPATVKNIARLYLANMEG